MVVLCAGMYRSGSTLQYQVASELVERYMGGKRIEWKPLSELNQYLSNYDDSQVNVIKTHEIDSGLQQFIKNNKEKVKIVYIYRDLRDVFFSHMVKNNLDFNQVYQSDFLYRCIDTYNAWMSIKDIHFSKYEFVINDLKYEVERIARFLDITLEGKLIDEIAKKFSFENQKKRVAKINLDNTQFFKNLKFDTHNLLHHNHLNKGEVGGWKISFTTEEKKLLNENLEFWLQKNGYEL